MEKKSLQREIPRKKRQSLHWLGRSAARAALVIVLVMVAVFFLIRMVPGDPAVMILGEHADEAAILKLRERLNLNLPLSQQFFLFLKNVFLHGDTGTSIKYGVSCRQLIFQYAPVTLLLVLLSTVLTVSATILLAYEAATHQDGVLDQVIRVLPAFTHGMPVFWIGLIFILLFSVRLKWFPVGGLEEGALGMLHSLILPAVTVSFGQIPALVRSLREQFLEVLHADFVVTLKALKLPKRRILFHHVLKNAIAPTLMLFSVNVSYLIGGTLVIEQVFAVRGMGKLLFEAIANRDFPLVQGIALYCAVFVVLISFLVDLIVHRLDPRTEK